MAFFKDGQTDTIKISRMALHLVGPTPKHFQILEEVSPGKFSDFFVDRIKAVGGGNLYEFSDASATRERLARIAADGRQFEAEGQKIAQDFQNAHGGSTSPGAFILFSLHAGREQIFALLKFDDESVLSYEVEELANGKKKDHAGPTRSDLRAKQESPSEGCLGALNRRVWRIASTR